VTGKLGEKPGECTQKEEKMTMTTTRTFFRKTSEVEEKNGEYTQKEGK
jgi:hypothetical protein